ncbi:uncharacterized protein MONOS_9190 [Monocercomonoides exilis]|uniref:uncharacterized protein n=1 Tax=Monocercomonoides exilis TaxID=2049356 RepID=UPI003559D67A|nr:hypothetical protein MONOS_9190 [Monocercomonoides exilis]|eukprot:MONOS_9190.1-p1 / transcript=MONOS_9190.1 / gene=MONOS_9190 / organism=Monocercomonoides_exilis_PA203 / gene_product=unspecified product / transcript_product=unspecified product / location=Mono_scaffold00370:47760-48380(+) / protein_length=207 / sequence_SO=supercontig / SO=protein_coding / is_pseudo=false
MEDGCGEGGLGGKQGAALAGRGSCALVDEYLVGAVEGDEVEDVDVEAGVGVGGVGAADGGVGCERGLGEVEGKEGLVDLGEDGGAPEKEVLSSEGVVEGEADVEDGEGDGRNASRTGVVVKEASALGRLFAHAAGEHTRLGSAVNGTSLFHTHQSWLFACAHDVCEIGRIQNDCYSGIWSSQASQTSQSGRTDGHNVSASEQRGED